MLLRVIKNAHRFNMGKNGLHDSNCSIFQITSNSQVVMGIKSRQSLI